jgi:hypothetical protein
MEHASVGGNGVQASSIFIRVDKAAIERGSNDPWVDEDTKRHSSA